MYEEPCGASKKEPENMAWDAILALLVFSPGINAIINLAMVQTHGIKKIKAIPNEEVFKNPNILRRKHIYMYALKEKPQ